MTITFFTNYIHHHQIPVADEFYRMLGDDYKYVAMERLPDWLIKGGYNPHINSHYIIRAYEGESSLNEAKRLMMSSDIVIAAAAPKEELLRRKKEDKVTFHYSERWNKEGGWHRFDPRTLLSVYRNHYRFRNKRIYMLCASAFTAHDVHFYHCYPNRCFKWGYMTKVDMSFALRNDVEGCDSVSIMWCARFLSWKHPELPIMLAKRLKDKGYKFTIDMYGNGVEFDRSIDLANSLDVNEVLRFCGNAPNEKILQAMREHDIFLFTSDRCEGWGAVANESMSNGCAIVASNEIGSIPYLVKDGENGLVFKSGDIDSLEEKVIYLLEHADERNRIANNAIKTMRDIWSPANAAKTFIELAEHVLNNTLNEYNKMEGPASWDNNK